MNDEWFWRAVVVVLACAVVSYLLTRLLVALAPKLQLLDRPNMRSSHTVVTPRGGGLAIVIVGLTSGVWIGNHGQAELGIVLATGLAIALLGLLDDRFPLAVRWRLSCQVLLAAMLVYSAAPLPVLPLTSVTVLSGTLLAALVVLAAVWWINLFNFMDGIDGIAASQAAMMLLVMAWIIHSTGLPAAGEDLFRWMLALCGAVIGFLVVNWAPARIFMGDVGSLYLGLTIFGIGLLTVSSGVVGYGPWLITASLFVVDATFTLCARALDGQVVHQAHREHIYQILARYWQSHARVTLLYTALNVLLVAPLAWVAARKPAMTWPLIVSLYCGLALVAWLIRRRLPRG
ncbi:MAG: glycosyltransferase family 4 protein [Gammaproteobacteria bacterium]|nr:glycosyltransferase family 4 protein [Gammaproteobacteria bacterium]